MQELNQVVLEVNQVKKTSIRDDVFNNLEVKNETKTSFEYLKNNTEVFFDSFPNIFDSDLKEFFNYIASEEKIYIDYEVLSRQILIPSKNIFSFLMSIMICIIFVLIYCLTI